jgi:acyl-CoA thioesterase YciA
MADDPLPFETTEFEVATRHMVMERHLNPFGHLFGGAMLGWLDEGAALYLMEKIGYRDFVTVSMDNVSFKAPGHRGDAIQILCRIVRTGRSSVVVQAKAVSHEAESGAVHEIITCDITYVCLKDHTPYPYFQSDEFRAWLGTRGRNMAPPAVIAPANPDVTSTG